MHANLMFPLFLVLLFTVNSLAGEQVKESESLENRPLILEMHAWRIKDGKLHRMDAEVQLPRETVGLALDRRRAGGRNGLIQFSTRQGDVLWRNSVHVREIQRDRVDIKFETCISEGDFRLQGRFEATPSPTDKAVENVNKKQRYGYQAVPLDKCVTRTAGGGWRLGADLEWVRDDGWFDARMEMKDAPLALLIWVRTEQDPLPDIIRALERKNSSFFPAAIAAGWRSADADPAVPFLIDALNDDGTTERRLENAREDKTGWRPRAAAAEALGRIGPVAKEAVPRLTELLKDEFEGVRYQAAIALGEIRHPDPEAIAALEALAKSTNDVRLREFAEDSLCQLQRAARKEAKKSAAP
jgi:hypothetical protein